MQASELVDRTEANQTPSGSEINTTKQDISAIVLKYLPFSVGSSLLATSACATGYFRYAPSTYQLTMVDYSQIGMQILPICAILMITSFIIGVQSYRIGQNPKTIPNRKLHPSAAILFTEILPALVAITGVYMLLSLPGSVPAAEISYFIWPTQCISLICINRWSAVYKRILPIKLTSPLVLGHLLVSTLYCIGVTLGAAAIQQKPNSEIFIKDGTKIYGSVFFIGDKGIVFVQSKTKQIYTYPWEQVKFLQKN